MKITILEGADRYNPESELDVESFDEMFIHFWAMARCSEPTVCWAFPPHAMEWQSNHACMDPDLKIPDNISRAVHAEIARQDAILNNENNNREVTVTLKLSSSNHFLVSCPQMRYEGVSTESNLGRELMHLYYEFQSHCEA